MPCFDMMVDAAMGKGKYPARMTPILICKYMGWSWQDLQQAPAHRVDDIILMMQADAAAANAGEENPEQKQVRQEREYLARTEARGTRTR